MTDETLGRRGFIGGTAAAATGLGTAGCAHEARPATTIEPGDVSLWMGRLDRSVEAIEQSPLLADLMPPSEPADSADPEWARVDRQLRGCLRSLYVSGAFQDLPPEAREHPAIQDRMRAEVPTIEESGATVLDLLERSSSEERRAVRQELRDDPDAIQRFVQVIDERATIGGLRPQRRRQMRDIFRLAGWRLRSQAPSIIIDEYVSKARRLRSWPGMGPIAGPQGEESGSVLGPVPPPPAAGQDVPPPPAGTSGGAAPPTEPPAADRRFFAEEQPDRQRLMESGQKRMRAGGWMLGLGLVVGPSGGVAMGVAPELEAGWFVGAFAVTLGIVLFVLGIIFLASGARRRARAQRPPGG